MGAAARNRAATADLRNHARMSALTPLGRWKEHPPARCPFVDVESDVSLDGGHPAPIITTKGIAMRLNTLLLCAFVMLHVPLASAQSKPDPLFGEDPHARAVLDCHADYARRFARALTPVKGTPTEVATAAYASCAG